MPFSCPTVSEGMKRNLPASPPRIAYSKMPYTCGNCEFHVPCVVSKLNSRETGTILFRIDFIAVKMNMKALQLSFPVLEYNV